MDTTTVNTIINLIDNQIAANKEKMQAKGFNMETPAQAELTKLKEHLQSFIEAELTTAENNTVE